MLSVSPAVACPLITEPLATLGIASAIFRNIATPVSVVVKSPEPSTAGYTKSPTAPGSPGTKSITPFAGLNKKLFGPGPGCVTVPTSLLILSAFATSNIPVFSFIQITSPSSNPCAVFDNKKLSAGFKYLNLEFTLA